MKQKNGAAALAVAEEHDPSFLAKEEIVLLRPDYVKIDAKHNTQRDLQESHARSIAKDYSPSLFGLGHVSERSDGEYYVLDGQHRVTAAIMAGKGHVPVPFKVWRGLTLQGEAEKFALLNQKKLSVNAYQRFKVGVTARTPENVEIVRVLASFGLKFGLAQQDGVVVAVQTLVDLYEQRVRLKVKDRPEDPPGLPQNHLLSRTLQILTKAWGKSHAAFDSFLLRGVAGLLYKHGARVDADRLAKNLTKSGTPQLALGKIKALKESGKLTHVAAGVLFLESIYNAKLSDEKRLT